MGRRDYCDNCQMQPCIGGRGPGSCEKGSKEPGERRSTRVGPPENTVEHVHDYQLEREYDETLRDGRRTYKYYYKEFRCHNRKGECGRPVHLDMYRRVRVS